MATAEEESGHDVPTGALSLCDRRIHLTRSLCAVYLQPDLPKNAGSLESCVQLQPNDTYLLDGRVKMGKIGCGWKADGIDVDVSLAMYNVDMKCVDVLWWDKKRSHYVSATHLNDDRNGTVLEGTDINEQMLVRAAVLDPLSFRCLVCI